MATNPTDPDSTTTRGTHTSWNQLFAILWGVAILFHLFSDFQTLFGWRTLEAVPLLSLVLGIAALVVVATRRQAALVVMAVIQLVVFWLAFPAVSNHWIVAAAINLAVVVASAASWNGRLAFDGDRFWRLFAPTGRWLLIVFYSFAAFAKWNSDFFDPAVSCAVVLGEISAASFGLSALFALPAVRWLVIVLTWGIESAIPLLLIFRRTRYWGVLLGITFHFALAADWMRHFYDFSSLLIALFALFLPTAFAGWLADSIHTWLSPARRRVLTGTALTLLAFLTITPGLGIESVQVATFLLNQAAWYVYGGVMIWLVWRFGRRVTRRPEAGMWRLAHPLLALLPLLLVVNGLLAYGETRRGRGFDMYSNLRAAEGETNHWVLPAYPVTPAMSDPIEILAAEDEALAYYLESDLSVSFLALRKYLSIRPDTPITVGYGGETIALDRAADYPALVEPLPWWQRKFLTFKPIDQRPSNRCFDQFRTLD